MPPQRPADVALVAAHCRSALAAVLSEARIGEEYGYASLPLAVMDAVYSIGVTYTATRNTVIRYCEATETPRLAADPEHWPPAPEAQLTLSAFTQAFDRLGPDVMAEKVFGNRQRTSSTYGILKSEAVRRVAQCLIDAGVETFQDFAALERDPQARAALESEVRAVPGQTTGISWSYFRMLAGSEADVKPDRMVVRFVEEALGRPLGLGERGTGDARRLVQETVRELLADYPHLTPRRLDYLVWSHQRSLLAQVPAPEAPTPKRSAPVAVQAPRAAGASKRAARASSKGSRPR